jgi:polyhydroxyalkanoate synthesis repressor PhaR
MPRLIKRYGSRKLYDARESRYVSLEEVASYIRAGEAVRVVDAHSGDDLTGFTLTQLLNDEERRGVHPLSPAFLHAVIRGSRSIGRAQPGAARTPASQARSLRRVREELEQLRAHLEQLARSLDALETPAVAVRKRKRAVGSRD